MNISPDIVRELGLLSLGTRLRRLGERLQSESQPILDTLDPRIASACHPTMRLLGRHESLTIGQIAAELGVAQPGVTRNVAALVKIGIVAVTPDPDDARVRQVSLTPEGRAMVDRARRHTWVALRGAMEDLCDGFEDELLALLDRIEDGLDEKPLIARMEDKP